MTFVAILILAWQSGRLLPVSLLPDISIPEISIHINLANASARELEQTAVQKIREQCLQLNGLRHIESEARQENALIRIQLEYGVDADLAFMEVNEKIDQAMNDLPREMERPRVIQASAADLPVFYLNLSLKGSSTFQEETLKWLEFSTFTRQVIRRRLEQLPELALVDISGYAEAEVYIIPDEEKMKSLNIGQEFIQQLIQDNNTQLGNITVQDGQYQYTVQLDFQMTSVEDVRNLYFKHAGQVLQLKDIANVGIRQQALKGLCLAGNQLAISMAIIKQSRARVSDLEAAVKQLISHFEQEYPDIQFQLLQDQAGLLRLSISNLQQSLFLGCVLVILIMFVFMRNWRAPAIVGISVPVALMISLIFFYLFKISVNIISLSGLIMGVGLMIDNAVIVVDNIAQVERRGLKLEQACVLGTEQVIRPLIASAMTTCMIFLPLIFLSGITGVLFFDQAVAITIGLGVSLLVSITLIPTLYWSFFSGNDEEGSRVENKSWLSELYSKSIYWVFRHSFLTLLGTLLLITAGLYFFMHLPRLLLPELDKNEMLVDIHWNESISLKESRRRITMLSRHFKEVVKESSSLIGESQYLFIDQGPSSNEEAVLYLQTADGNSKKKLEPALQQYFMKFYPSARLHIRNSETIFDYIFPEEPLLKAVITTRGLDEAEQIDVLQRFCQNIGDLQSSASLPAIEESIQLQVLPENLLLYDVPLERLHDLLQKKLSAKQVSLLRTYHDRIPMVVSAEPQHLSDLLNGLYVKNNQNINIPVRSLVLSQSKQQFQSIYADQSGPVLPLEIETPAPAKTIQSIRRFTSQNNEVDIKLSGRYFSSLTNIYDLLCIMLIAIALLYFILAAQFGSLLQPLIILLEIPISLSGALAALYLFDSSLNLLSMIGMIVLTGIIINDSILKVDMINRLRQTGLPLMEAIHEGGMRRLHPILMTSLTTILALLPFLLRDDMSAQLQSPLALALIGGMLVGTLVSLYIIPLLYYGIYVNKSR